jgi:hypothetical protein
MSQTKAQLIDGKSAEIEFTGGSASAPAISFTGDPNTGIYSPGADQVAISTGGSGRLFVDASGRVLVGTPSARSNIDGGNSPQVQIEGAGYPAATFSITRDSADTGAPIFYFAKTRSGSVGGNTVVQSSDTLGQFIWTGSDGTNTIKAAEIKAEVDGTPGANDMPGRIVLSTTADGASSPTERLRITSAGLVGIGTSSPSSTAGGLDISSGGIGLVVGADGSTVTRTNSTDKIFRIGSYHYTNAEEPVCIAFGQNLSSDNELNFGGGSAALNAATYIRFFTAANNTTTTGTERVRIDNAGRVGIGTTSPAGILDIDVTGDQLVRFQTTAAMKTRLVTGNSDVSAIEFSDNAAYRAKIQAETSDAISFYTGGITTEAARLDSSGRLLVGTSSSSNLYAIGGANFAPKVQIQGTDPIELGVQRTDGPPYVHIANGQSGLASGNDVGFISFNGKDSNNLLVQAAQISAAVDGTPGANDMPGRLVFSTTADGASSPTERMRIGQNGGVAVRSTGNYPFVSNSSSAPGTTATLFAGNCNASDLVGTGATTVFIVYNNGNVQNTNNSYAGISDIKLKENIVDASSQWDDLKALQVRKYNFKEETKQETHTQIGLIAQEVELVSPGLVSESPDRDEDGNDLGTVTKSVNYSVLYMKAVKALQEAMERIEQLEAEMAEVKAQLS